MWAVYVMLSSATIIISTRLEIYSIGVRSSSPEFCRNEAYALPRRVHPHPVLTRAWPIPFFSLVSGRGQLLLHRLEEEAGGRRRACGGSCGDRPETAGEHGSRAGPAQRRDHGQMPRRSCSGPASELLRVPISHACQQTFLFGSSKFDHNSF